MLSSIHPLGERARHNSWWLTVSSFTLGAVVAGASVGALVGWIGAAFLSDIDPTVALGATAATAVLAGLGDFSSVEPPGPHRQVNETWIGAFRGWVYGGGFGLQLGAGVLTYIVTWAVYAMFVAEFLAASPTAGGVVGGIFGLGRSLSLLAAVLVDRPSRLTSFNRTLANAGPQVRRASAMVLTGLGTLMLMVGLL